jgi:hypothetical protein
VFENKVLRRIFGPNREEVAGGWKRLHNEELLNLYASPYTTRAMKSRRNGMGGACSTHGEMMNSYDNLVTKPEGKGPLGTPRRRREDNIRMDLRKIG